MLQAIKASYLAKNELDCNSAYVTNATLKKLHAFKANYKQNTTLVAIADYLEIDVLRNYYNSRIHYKSIVAGDFVPDNVEDWDKNTFYNQIHNLTFEALRTYATHSQLSTNYPELIDLNKDGNIYTPTVFDQITVGCLDKKNFYSDKDIEDIFNDWMSAHKNDKNPSAYIYASLNYIKYSTDNIDKKINKLNKLLSKYKDVPASNIIRKSLADNYLTKFKNTLTIDKTVSKEAIDKMIEICKTGMRKFPEDAHNDGFQKLLDITQTQHCELSLSNNNIRAGQQISLKAKYYNISNLKISLFRLECQPEEWAYYLNNIKHSNNNADNFKKIKIKDYTITLKPSHYIIPIDTVIEIERQNFGNYLLVYGNDSIAFEVSNILPIVGDTRTKQGFTPVLVVDSKTGSLLNNITVKEINHEFKVTNIDSIHNGLVNLTFSDKPDRTPAFLNFTDYSGKDCYNTICTPIYNSNYWCNSKKYTSILTDRSVYRPGQTVYFKAISYMINPDASINVIKSDHYSIGAFDGNSTQIYDNNAVANDYGSFSDSIIIPVNAKLGVYEIIATNGSTTFRVEEYKRPTFDVDICNMKDGVIFGEKLTVHGKARYLDDTPLQKAKVKYRITRKPNQAFWWWKCYICDHEEEICHDTVATDNEGNFQISFTPVKDRMDFGNTVCYTYEVTATVTDANGESHDVSNFVNVGDQRVAIITPHKDKMTFEQFQDSKLYVVNMNNEGVNYNIEYKIYSDTVMVAKGQILSDSVNGFKLPVSSLVSGKYNIKISAVDGDKINANEDFTIILYHNTDSKPPVYSTLWTGDEMGYHYVNKYVNDLYSVYVGTSLPDANLIILTSYDNGEFKVHNFTLNNEIRQFNFKLRRNRHLYVKFFLVHDGIVEQEDLILQDKEDTHIPVQLSVFRDKVEAGSKETWKISVPKQDLYELGIRTNQLELLSTMYDASLDLIYPHSWNFHPEFREYYSPADWTTHNNFNHIVFSKSVPAHYKDFSLKMNYWKDFHYSKSDLSVSIVVKDECCEVNTSDDLMSMSDYNPLLPENVKEAQNESSAVYSNKEKQPKVRSNFAETAFFYPHTYFDVNGNAEISFTMPDQLTRWKFMALVHSVYGSTGSLSKYIVSQKQFSITPNYPRFLRHGDTCTFTAKVTNLDSVHHNGKARLQFFDPVTNAVIVDKAVDFKTDAHQNNTVKWDVIIPDSIEAVVMRTTAIDQMFSDAEQKLLPILSDRVTLTQSMPMYIRAGQTKEYDFKNLTDNNSTTLKSKLLKFELCPNPAWSCVKCLPTMCNDIAWGSIGTANRIYALGLSKMIIKKNPTIFNIISAWKDSTKDNNKQSLLSSLYKNEEVKNILLNESPWVLEAKDETEQYEHLSTLLNITDLQNTIYRDREVLRDYRDSKGGYKWMCSCPKTDFYVTVYILDNFIRLINAGVNVFEDYYLERDVRYIDNYVTDKYNRLKNNTEKLQSFRLSMLDLYYLQVRTSFLKYNKYYYNIDDKNKEAYQFMCNLVKKQWPSYSLYGKALSAITLEQDSDHVDALKIVNSLREYSKTTDEDGMFWPNNHSTWLWEDDAISTHTRIMEALRMISPNDKEQDELKIWLINQKRTQDWGNPIATIEALNMLLMDGKTLSQNNAVTAQLGNMVIEPKNAEPGTGSYAVSFTGSQIKPEMGKVKLTSTDSANISFGGMYWQFEELIEKVKFNQTGLSVDKQVMLQTISNGHESIIPVTDKTVLKVGDKLVIRLVVRADRDYEYVCLKDQRASCLEPLQQISKWDWCQGVGYIQMPRDAAMYYFFDHLPKGSYTFEYPLYVTHGGNYCNGITNIQCLYAPEFSSNTGSVRIKVTK